MITYGARGNPDPQSLQSLGAHASGNVHTFTRFRTGADGASLHPLQRSGAVSASSHSLGYRMTAMGPAGLGDAPHAATFNRTLPPVMNLYGSPSDPAMRI